MSSWWKDNQMCFIKSIKFDLWFAYQKAVRVLYLYDITGWCSGCTFHTGVGHHLIDGWRGELLLVHARVGHLGPMLSLDHGLRGPGGHWLGLRVSAQRSHDGCSDGCRRGVVLQDRLSEDTVHIHAVLWPLLLFASQTYLFL